MQIARLQCSKFENARMDTVWQVWCVRCKSTHCKMCAVSMKTDRRTIWHSKCTQAHGHIQTRARRQMSVSPDIVRCQFKSVVFSCCRVLRTAQFWLTWFIYVLNCLMHQQFNDSFFGWASSCNVKWYFLFVSSRRRKPHTTHSQSLFSRQCVSFLKPIFGCESLPFQIKFVHNTMEDKRTVRQCDRSTVPMIENKNQ